MTKERWIKECKERIYGFYVESYYIDTLKTTIEIIANYIDKENLWGKRLFEGHRLLADALLDVYEYAMSDLVKRNEVVPPIKDMAAYANFVVETSKSFYIKHRTISDFNNDVSCDLESSSCVSWALVDTAGCLVKILRRDNDEN